MNASPATGGNTPPVLTAEYEITEADLMAFNHYHLRHSPTARRQYLRAWLGPAILGALVLGVIWYLVDSKRGTPLNTFVDLLPLFCAVPAYLIFYPFAYRRSVRRAINGMIAEGKNRGVLGRHRVMMTPESITKTGEFSQSTTSWRAVERVVSSGEHVFIYVSALAAIVIPRRAFPSVSEFTEFVHTAAAHRAQAVS